jgi:hypothetical protein
MFDSMVVDRARCRCDVQQARLSLHVPLLTSGAWRHRWYVIGLRMCKVRTGSTCALGAPQRLVPALGFVHAVYQDGMIEQEILPWVVVDFLYSSSKAQSDGC